jgi:hypothetical protein
MYPVRLMGVDGRPMVLEVADFDRDGKSDLFLADRSDDISVLLGRGNGTFEEPLRSEVAGLGSRRVAATSVVDFDRDGRLDVVLALNWEIICRIAPPCQTIPGHVVVLRGLGDGRFSEMTRAVAADHPGTVVTGDFDGDGTWDVAVSDYSYYLEPVGRVLVLLGDPNGNLEPAISYLPSSWRLSLTVADFDHDGRDDLAAAEPYSRLCDPTGCTWVPGSIRILWGQKDGQFIEGDPFTEGGSLIAAGRFDRDAHVDLAVVSDGMLGILLNRGKGAFELVLERQLGRAPGWLIVDDLDEDGHQDIITANNQTNDVSVLLGDGRGGFGADARYGVLSAPRIVAAGDFTSDGVKDLALLGAFDSPYLGSPPAVALLEGAGRGSFLAPARRVTEEGESVLTIADFDQDGDSDIAVATPSQTICGQSDCPTTPGAVKIFLSHEQGLAASGTTFESCNDPVDMASADLDVNGIPDLVVACRSLPPCRLSGCEASPAEFAVLLGQSGASFSSPIRIRAPDNPAAIVLEDFDEDGRPDLASVSTWIGCTGAICPLEPGYLSIGLGRGDGTFGEAMKFETGGSPTDIAASDLDGNGHVDLVVTNRSFRSIPDRGTPEVVTSMFYGRGDGTVGAPIGISDTGGAERILVTALNDDHVPDLVLGYFDEVALLLGTGGGAFGDAQRFHAGFPIASLAAGDLDGDGSGDIVLAAEGAVAILMGSGHGGVEPLRQFAAGGPTRSIGIGAFDDDRPNDIAVTTCASQYTIRRRPPALQRCSGDTGLSLLLRQPFGQRIIDARIELRPHFGSRRGVIRWGTTEERTLTGFNILRIAGNGEREQLNASRIPCKECTTGEGAEYEYLLPKHRGGHGLYIEGICDGPCDGLLAPILREIGRP